MVGRVFPLDECQHPLRIDHTKNYAHCKVKPPPKMDSMRAKEKIWPLRTYIRRYVMVKLCDAYLAILDSIACVNSGYACGLVDYLKIRDEGEAAVGSVSDLKECVASAVDVDEL